MRLTDIASESGIHLATVQRILSVMLQYGYVSQERYGYTVGVTSVMNAFSFHVTSSLNQITQPILQELTTASGLMSSLAIRVDFVQVMVLRVEGTAPLRYLLPVGEATPLYLGGARIFAAALAPDELSTLLATVPEIRLASGQIVTEQELLNSLKEIRDQGYAHSVSERELGSSSVAVPVYGQEGTLEASLQVSGPTPDLDDDKVEWCVLELKRASAAITKRLP